MNLYLSHISALELLRNARQHPLRSAVVLEASDSSSAEFKSRVQSDFSALSSPVHVLITKAGDRTKREDIICHIFSGTLPKRAFVCIGKDTYASSPELCFVQLASVLTLVQLIELGFELCGAYRRVCTGKGFVQAKPLTSRAKLRRFVEGVERVEGIKQARRALDCIADNSASPMESVAAMLLCLPCRLGGYGLPYPVMNQQITVTPNRRKAVSKSCYYCDLYWPGARLAIEYDSDEYHTGTDHIFRDSSRRANLAYLGIEVVSLTKLQVLSYAELDKVVILLEKRLGRRRRISTLDWTNKRAALRRQLLNFSGERT